MNKNPIEFRISPMYDRRGWFIYFDDGESKTFSDFSHRRWLLPDGILTNDTNLATKMHFMSHYDAEGFLKNWKPAEGFMSKANVQLYAGISECFALDCAIEHWKQIVLNIDKGGYHVGPETCSLCVYSKKEASIVGPCCRKCILNDYKETTFSERSGSDFFETCSYEYQAFMDAGNIHNAIEMLNKLTELRNNKYGHATYTEFGTIKNVTELKSDFQKEGQKIVQDILNAKDGDVISVPKLRQQSMTTAVALMNVCDFAKAEKLIVAQIALAKFERLVVQTDEFNIQHLKEREKYGDPAYYAVHRKSKKYLCHDGKLQSFCANGWYASKKLAVKAAKAFVHRAMTVGEIEDELGIKVLLTQGDVQDALSEPVPEGYGAIKEVPICKSLISAWEQFYGGTSSCPVLGKVQFKPGDVVRTQEGNPRIVIDVGYLNGLDFKMLATVDVDGNIRGTCKVNGPQSNFNHFFYTLSGRLRPESDFILQPVDCTIQKGDVVTTNWPNGSLNELRFVVEHKGDLRFYNFGGQLNGLIKKGQPNLIGYRKVGRIEDYL